MKSRYSDAERKVHRKEGGHLTKEGFRLLSPPSAQRKKRKESEGTPSANGRTNAGLRPKKEGQPQEGEKEKWLAF